MEDDLERKVLRLTRAPKPRNGVAAAPLDPLTRKIAEATRLAAEADAQTLVYLLSLCELEARTLAGLSPKGRAMLAPESPSHAEIARPNALTLVRTRNEKGPAPLVRPGPRRGRRCRRAGR